MHPRLKRGIRISVVLLTAAISTIACGDGDPEIAPSQPAVSSTAPTGGASEVVLAFPADGDQVRQCEILSGRSSVAPDQTIVVGVRNLDNNDSQRYFEAVTGWEYPDSLASWSGKQWFGSGNTAVGQEFRIEVLVMKRDDVQKALKQAKKDGWHQDTNPPNAQIGAHTTVKRVKGPGPAECT
jgi:hypothetical protein